MLAKKPSLGLVLMQEVGMLHPLLEALIHTHRAAGLSSGRLSLDPYPFSGR